MLKINAPVFVFYDFSISNDSLQMGKSKKVRKGPTSRSDPLQNTNASNGNGHVALNGILSSAVLDTITAQLQSGLSQCSFVLKIKLIMEMFSQS